MHIIDADTIETSSLCVHVRMSMCVFCFRSNYSRIISVAQLGVAENVAELFIRPKYLRWAKWKWMLLHWHHDVCMCLVPSYFNGCNRGFTFNCSGKFELNIIIHRLVSSRIVSTSAERPNDCWCRCNRLYCRLQCCTTFISFIKIAFHCSLSEYEREKKKLFPIFVWILFQRPFFPTIFFSLYTRIYSEFHSTILSLCSAYGFFFLFLSSVCWNMPFFESHHICIILIFRNTDGVIIKVFLSRK